ncbi:MAG: hypothetical protein ACKVH8_12155 [Pirellulales bacterium]|jgi:hypothetical protein
MPHSLTPNANTPKRTLDELLHVLRDNFSVFESDRDKGDQHITQMIGHWQRMLDGYKRWKDPPPQIGELQSQMERFSALRGNAAFVVVAADEYNEDLAVSFNLIPDEEILIGYANQTHQDMATQISFRVATVLCYDVELT